MIWCIGEEAEYEVNRAETYEVELDDGCHPCDLCGHDVPCGCEYDEDDD